MAIRIEQLLTFCDRYALLPTGATIVVAVSGGPDSLSLLHLLRRIAPLRQLQLHVAHLDHQLRQDSAADAEFVAQIAAEWQLPATIGQADVVSIAREQRTGIEATARAVRSRFLLEIAQTVGATAIALGHTADDQAETVVMRLMRGAGPSGLAAMRPKRLADEHSDLPDQPSIVLIRPLLETSRAEVEAYCIEQQLTPRYDSSNELPIFTRNRVRGYIIPLLKTYNPAIVATLGRTARVCAEEDELLSELTEQVWAEIAQIEAGGIVFERRRWDQLHRAMQRRLVRKAAQLLEAKAELEAKHIDAILTAIAANRRRVQLPQGLWFGIGRAQLTLSRDETTG
ncbi:MAG: tRNA lysidine(34) synthetase TilS [Chloroflexi bacterium]|nr:tRNA lysidine(34) synthetase TilS [Chloroflexota bacterium]